MSDALWSGCGDSSKNAVMCSLSISGTGNVFGSAHEREIWLKQSKEKEDILILRQASLHFHCLHATHSADSAENRVLPV